MIILSTHRNYLYAAINHFFFFSAIEQYKATRLNNVAGHDADEYLSEVVNNCILSQVELLFKKKLINTTTSFLKIKLSDAEAVILYKSLLNLPLPENQQSLHMIRNEWIHILHKQLIALNLVNVSTYETASVNHFS